MLNKIQEDKIQQLLGDELMLKIIEQVFNETLDNNLPRTPLLANNELIGQQYRAYEQAKGIIRAAFADLLSHKRENEKQNRIVNKAR